MEDFSVQHSDPSTERLINSVICQFGREAFEDIDDLVTPNTFTITHNQIVYKCLRHIFTTSETNENIKVDPSLILATARTLQYGDFFTQPKEIKLIDRLFEMPIELSNARKLAAQIRKLEIRRLIYKQLMMGISDLNEIPHDTPIEQLISQVEGRILDFTSLLSDDAKQISLIGDDLDEYVQHLIDNPCESIGISTGYPLYDLAVGGLRRGSTQLIAARAKAGKSMLCINIGMHIAGKLNLPTLYLDTEMGKRDHHNRMLANLADVDIDDIETGKFAKNRVKKAKVLAAKDKLKTMPFHYVSIAGKPTEEILSIMRKWVTKTVGTDENGHTKDCVIIYDYLKIMDQSGLTKNIQETMLMGFLTTALNNFMVKYDVACLAFAQLNRDGVTKDSISNIASSDRLTWFCSSVSSYSPKFDDEIEECGERYGNRKLVPLISRYGGGIGDGNYINMFFNGKRAQIKQGKDYFTIKAAEQSGDYSDIDKISENLNEPSEDQSENIVPWE